MYACEHECNSGGAHGDIPHSGVHQKVAREHDEVACVHGMAHDPVEAVGLNLSTCSDDAETFVERKDAEDLQAHTKYDNVHATIPPRRSGWDKQERTKRAKCRNDPCHRTRRYDLGECSRQKKVRDDRFRKTKQQEAVITSVTKCLYVCRRKTDPQERKCNTPGNGHDTTFE